MPEKLGSPVDFRKKREVREIYRDSLQFLKSEWKPLGKLLLIYVFPFIAVYAVAQILFQMRLTLPAEAIREMEPEKMMNELGPVYKNLLITLAFNLFVQSLFMAAAFSYINVYIHFEGTPFNWRRVTPLLFANTLLTLGAAMAVAAISFAGLIFFILPGIIFANSLSLSVFIANYERKGIYPALMRSFILTRKGWWSTLTLNLTAILIIWSVNLILSLPATSYETSAAVTGGESATKFMLWQWVVIGVALAVSSLFSIFGYLFQAMQYFNLSDGESDSSDFR